YVQVFSKNESRRSMMTLHVRDDGDNVTCTCRSYAPGWDTFSEIPTQDLINIPKLAQSTVQSLWKAGSSIRIRTWDFYHPASFQHYHVDPHPEGYDFLIKIRFWGKLRKVKNDYLEKIKNYFRPEDWHAKEGVPP